MRRGFTLIDVLVVLVLLGIMAAVTIPALGRVAAGDPLSGAADEVTGVLRQARKTAVERGKMVQVTIAPGEARYWVWITGDDTSVLAEGTFALGTAVGLIADTPRALVRFSPRGAASGGPIGILGDGRTVLIEVDRWTGELRVRGR